MLKTFPLLLLFVSEIFLSSCNSKAELPPIELQVAFIADIHFQNIYGNFSDSDYKGVKNPGNSEYVIARTMQSQVNSTRIFNENYFAFLAALDDIAQRGIEYVVLPGDFSDDGQPINIRGLKSILDRYSQKYGIRFIATTGNHDPVQPFSLDAGKTDFLGEGGRSQAIMSAEGMYIPNSCKEYPAVITRDMRTMGYQEIISALSNWGFFPQEDDLYWETPFSTYDVDSYTYEKAMFQASLENRHYSVPPFDVPVPDVSYLVEPIKDIWFLAIDANVYIPQNSNLIHGSFSQARIGYNNVLTHKKHLIDWVKRVADEAEKRGKVLVAFSHYPMVDFNDDATPHLKSLFGETKVQLHRVPTESVARVFADAGIRLHFGGHMHINDTGIRESRKGNVLVNVQIPSLAAYIPAYKLLTIHNHQIMEIETIIIDSVPRFNELFPIYELEYAYLKDKNNTPVWDKDILTAKSYHEYTNMHLKQLVRNRFLKTDWPDDFVDFLLKSTGKDLLMFSINQRITLPENIDDFETWTGFDMIFDFYRLHSADKLAIADIGIDRIHQYQFIIDALITNRSQNRINDNIQNDFLQFAKSFHHILNGEPAGHFQIDICGGQINSVDEDMKLYKCLIDDLL